MRVAFALVGLALSVVAIGACGEGQSKDADAIACMAYLSLQSAAVHDGRVPGDAAALDGAAVAWRSLAAQKYSADELAEYFAGSVAAFSEISATDLQQVSTACLAHAPV